MAAKEAETRLGRRSLREGRVNRGGRRLWADWKMDGCEFGEGWKLMKFIDRPRERKRGAGVVFSLIIVLRISKLGLADPFLFAWPAGTAQFQAGSVLNGILCSLMGPCRGVVHHLLHVPADFPGDHQRADMAPRPAPSTLAGPWEWHLTGLRVPRSN